MSSYNILLYRAILFFWTQFFLSEPSLNKSFFPLNSFPFLNRTICSNFKNDQNPTYKIWYIDIKPPTPNYRAMWCAGLRYLNTLYAPLKIGRVQKKSRGSEKSTLYFIGGVIKKKFIPYYILLYYNFIKIRILYYCTKKGCGGEDTALLLCDRTYTTSLSSKWLALGGLSIIKVPSCTALRRSVFLDEVRDLACLEAAKGFKSNTFEIFVTSASESSEVDSESFSDSGIPRDHSELKGKQCAHTQFLIIVE